MYYRVKHNTLRTALFGAAWLDISHKGEMGEDHWPRTLLSETYVGSDRSAPVPEELSWRVPGGEVDRSECYYLLNFTAIKRRSLSRYALWGNAEVGKNDHRVIKLRNRSLCRNHRNRIPSALTEQGSTKYICKIWYLCLIVMQTVKILLFINSYRNYKILPSFLQ